MAPEDNIGNLKVPPRGCGTCQHALWATPAASGSPISMADHPCHRCSIGSSPVDWYPQYMPRVIQLETVVKEPVWPSPLPRYNDLFDTPFPEDIEPRDRINVNIGNPGTISPWASTITEPDLAAMTRLINSGLSVSSLDDAHTAPEPDLVFGSPPTPEAVAVEVGEPPQQELNPERITATEVREWMLEHEYMKVHEKCEAVQPTEPTLAKRDNSGKPALSVVLTFPEALRGVARAAAFGEKKYDRYNYLKGAPASQSVNSTLSHLLAWWSGEETDAESGLSHLDHFVWNALRLTDELTRRPELDDRPDPLLMDGAGSSKP